MTSRKLRQALLQVLDWATVVQRRSKPEAWELFTTGITFTPDPAPTSNLHCDWPGWWCHEDKERLLAGPIPPFLHVWNAWLVR